MSRSLRILLFAVGVAVATHVAAVYAMPWLIMHKAMAVMGRDGARIHRWIHAARAGPQARTIVRQSPDIAYSVCVFDLSKGHVRLRVHPSPGYWSLSLYAANSDNVRVWNDEDAPEGVDVLLVHGDAVVGDGVVALRSARGVAVVRRLAPSRQDWDVAAAVREHDRCEVE